MANFNYSLCKAAKSCKYGSKMSDSLTVCNYLSMTGKIRSRQPGGQIIDGKCELFVDKRKGGSNNE